MAFLSLILALVIEQIRPLPWRQHVESVLARLARRIAGWYDDGSAGMGRVAWLVVIAVAGLATWLAHVFLLALHPLLAFAFDTLVLYLLFGFRWHEKQYSDIHLALGTGRIDDARISLTAWRGTHHEGAGSAEIARLSIEHALVTGHRAVFGPLLWFLILPGPVGAVVYRIAAHLAREWNAQAPAGAFGVFARRAFEIIDWVPVRVTAIAFAVIGNFEEAMECWRTQAMLWHDRAAGILIASGGGALGVRLGLPVHAADGTVDRPAMGCGSKADIGSMQKAGKLLWRVLLLYVLCVGLLAIAGWVGA